MELLLWRHAQAEDGHDDMKRCLTVKGVKQAQDVATWIKAHSPRNLRILASPAQRTLQTAEALDVPFSTDDRLSPMASVDDLLTAVGWPEGNSEGDAVLVIGHQPTLGQVAARIMSGQDDAWSMKKGALWWLSHKRSQGIPKIALRTVIGPGNL
jgi:phosphohistidine phosphatase